MREDYTHWEDPVPVPLVEELVVSTCSSAVTAIGGVGEAVLGGCLPDVGLRAKLRQYLKLGRRNFSKKKQNYMKFLLKGKKKKGEKLTKIAEWALFSWWKDSGDPMCRGWGHRREGSRGCCLALGWTQVLSLGGSAWIGVREGS